MGNILCSFVVIPTGQVATEFTRFFSVITGCSRSLKLHVEYFKNGDKYNVGVNRSRIRKSPMGYRFAPRPLTLYGLEPS